MPLPTLPEPFQYFVDNSQAPTRLEQDARFPLAWHHWSATERSAVLQAWASGRPLLVRGEAGCGKSQIARAVAAVLDVGLISEVIHPRFEASDLLYRDDPVARLAQAQVISAVKLPSDKLDEVKHWVSEQLEPGQFVKPGPIWRAAKTKPSSDRPQLWPRAVVLIDEIDKADSDVPNALLDVLGNRSFEVPGYKEPVNLGREHAPLIVVTTNEDRELPPAFLRRCAVLNMRPDDKDENKFTAWLRDRANVHADFAPWKGLSNGPLDRAAKQVWDDREKAKDAGLATVGLAEYLDLLYGVRRLAGDDIVKANTLLDELSRFALVKHREQDQQREPVKHDDAG